MDSSEGDVTRLLRALGAGDDEALDRLLPLVYDELRAVATRHMRRERRDHTLQPTALVHEAYLRLVRRESRNWENRAHFLGVATQAIRRTLVEHARAKKRDKRGGGMVRVTLSEGSAAEKAIDIDVLVLDQLLTRLGEEEPMEQKIVELRFFGGLTEEETARALGVGKRTVERHWAFARAWLYRELRST
jgi:RNA polymerase sigma factor (TIGR02999 family)